MRGSMTRTDRKPHPPLERRRAGELLAVRAGDGAEVLVPFVSAIVVSVSLTDNAIEIDPPDGLLDL